MVQRDVFDILGASQKNLTMHICLFACSPFSGEVAQWLAPRICSANHEVGSSNLTVSTDDPLG